MGKKGKSTGLKRKPSPRFWPIHRKEYTWVVDPSPGPHERKNCYPLAIVLREYLKLANTRKEAKTIVSQGKIFIDGKAVREDDFPVGLLDVISIPDIGKSFRVMPSRKGLVLQLITDEEAKFKLCRIEDKKIVGKANVQLNLHDGSNLLVKIADPKSSQEDIYDTLDTIKITLPDKEILQLAKMKEADYALITGGKNVGRYGKIVEMEKTEGKKRRESLVTIEDEGGKHYQTTLNLLFAMGEEQPLIALPEVK